MNIGGLLELEKRLTRDARKSAETAQDYTNKGRLDEAAILLSQTLNLMDIQVSLSKILDGIEEEILDGIEEGVELEKN